MTFFLLDCWVDYPCLQKHLHASKTLLVCCVRKCLSDAVQRELTEQNSVCVRMLSQLHGQRMLPCWIKRPGCVLCTCQWSESYRGFGLVVWFSWVREVPSSNLGIPPHRPTDATFLRGRLPLPFFPPKGPFLSAQIAQRQSCLRKTDCWVCVCVCVCIYIYIYIYTHVHMSRLHETRLCVSL